MNPLDIPGLLCFWDFQDDNFVARGAYAYRLQPMGAALKRAGEGVFGASSLQLGNGGYLRGARDECAALNIYGTDAQVSVAAWLKREKVDYKGCQVLAGVWNEHGRRQYCLFLNLGIWESREQVGAHVSRIGGATPGYKYCMDAAIGQTPLPFNVWQCCAMSYDGEWARAYLNGKLDERGERNPYHYPGGLFNGSPHGADFTVGAVERPERVDDDFQEYGAVVANPFHGLLGGLAVYNRALTDEEMASLSALLP